MGNDSIDLCDEFGLKNNAQPLPGSKVPPGNQIQTPVSPKAPLPSEVSTVLSSGIGESTSSAGVSSPSAAGGTLIAMGIGKLTGSSEQKEIKKGLKICEKQGHSVSGRCYCCRIEYTIQIDYAGSAAMTNEFIYHLKSANVIKKECKYCSDPKHMFGNKGITYIVRWYEW